MDNKAILLLARLLAAGGFAGWCVTALGQVTYGDCGSLENAFGPLDYRTASQTDKNLVEGAHFTVEVEALRRGKGGYISQDISYTLRAFPNHPRALLAMMRLSEREKTERPKGSPYTVGCWFDRAVRLAPDDASVRVLYGSFLARRGAVEEALTQLGEAETKTGLDANLHYNLGLAFLDVKDYDRALVHAHQAYKLGFPLEGLKNRLRREGRWREESESAAGDPTTKKQ